jgi:hypothetical protein
MFMQQAVERKQTALSVVLGAQHQQRIFDGDNDGDRPDHERHAAEHVGRRQRRGAAAQEQLVHGVERRCTDIAIDDAERPYRQSRETSARRVGGVIEVPRRYRRSCFAAAFPRTLHEAGTRTRFNVPRRDPTSAPFVHC